MLNTSADLSSSISAGDRLVLTSGAYFASRNYYNVGEWVQVDSITSTTITLKAALEFSHSASDTIRLDKYVLSIGGLADIEVRAHEAATVRQTLAEFKYVDTPVIRDCVFSGAKALAGLSLRESMNPQAIDCVANDIRDRANTLPGDLSGYGVWVRGCLDAQIINLNGSRCRHLFDDAAIIGVLLTKAS